MGLYSGIADKVKNFAVIYVCDLGKGFCRYTLLMRREMADWLHFPDQVPDFKQMYGKFVLVSKPLLFCFVGANSSRSELYDPMTIMFFFRNKHMMCDFGTG